MKTRATRYALGGGIIGSIISAAALFLIPINNATVSLMFPVAITVFLAVTGLVLGRREDGSEEQASRLSANMKDAESLLSEVARATVTGNDWEVDLRDRHIPTCWEVKDCATTECPVFSKKNIRCWFIAGTYCGGEVQGGFAQKIGSCSECEVYQLAVEQHPVGQIHESFNNLLWVVNEKARLVASTSAELQLKYAELELLQAETRRLAETDALTGLYNYGHFHEFLNQEIVGARRFGRVFSLLMLDFDNFRQVNETYGYQQGDQVLVKLAEILQGATGANDYIARYGNEEFVVVLRDMDGNVAVEMARQISQGFTDQVEVLDGVPEDALRLSIGIADFPDCGIDKQSLLSAADAALFFARTKHNDNVAYFLDLSDTQLSADDIYRLQNRLHGAGMTTLKALARAVDATDQYPDGERDSLGRLAEGMARRLGLDDEEAELLLLATSLHDIGKIGIPSDILTKSDRLSEEELAMVKKHPEIGQEILREARQIQELVMAILYHHERWDGRGYPEGLEGARIPRMARIIGIFDAYRAMRYDRPYRKALTREQAIVELRQAAGSQFDPELVELFIEQLGDSEAREMRDAS